MLGSGLDSDGSRKILVENSCERGNELPGFMKPHHRSLFQGMHCTLKFGTWLFFIFLTFQVVFFISSYYFQNHAELSETSYKNICIKRVKNERKSLFFKWQRSHMAVRQPIDANSNHLQGAFVQCVPGKRTKPKKCITTCCLYGGWNDNSKRSETDRQKYWMMGRQEKWLPKYRIPCS